MQWQDPRGERVIKLKNGPNVKLISIKEGVYGKSSSYGDMCISKQGEKIKVDEKENT
jgi:long-subunit acyl-CoA synthetase (AMP-forming)